MNPSDAFVARAEKGFLLKRVVPTIAGDLVLPFVAYLERSFVVDALDVFVGAVVADI